VTQTFDNNEMFHLASALVNNSNRNIFLTGKAGTGKTTFLRHIKQSCVKQTAVVAPTGVAAINAGGTTIHSFFQLPFSPFIPETKGFVQPNSINNRSAYLSRLRVNSDKIKIFQQLELLIIDEISMVRCDMLDAIDAVLKHYRRRHHEPFGGVQILMIGDLFQLPPVSGNNEWDLLSEYYDSPYFFSSHVFRNSPALYIEFQKIYRQQDDQFIQLLNNVRNNSLDQSDFSLLNSLVRSNIKANSGSIVLTTHNFKADEINKKALEALKGKTYTFRAKIENEFSEKAYPADEKLELKIGAQVMFIKNDTEKVKRYFNGKIGVVKKIEDDEIYVQCENDDEEIKVPLETWDNLRYSLNNTSQQLEEEKLGSFTQYPLRLAWAITVHKSQGLTFKNAVIDAGAAFAPGQVYVALSRCTSLEGLQLTTPVNTTGLRTDNRIIEFSNQQASSDFLQEELKRSKKEYELNLLVELFSLKAAINICDDLVSFLKENEKSFNTETLPWVNELFNQLHALQKTSDNFSKHLDILFSKTEYSENNIELHERISSATSYFSQQINECTQKLLNSPAVTDSRIAAKTYNEGLRDIHLALSLKKHMLNFTDGRFSIEQYHNRKKDFVAPYFSVNAYAVSAGSDNKESKHPVLQMQLRQLRNKICEQSNAPIYMVASGKTIEEMVEFLPQTKEDLLKISGFGKAKAEAYGEKFLDIIISYCETNRLHSSMGLKQEKKERKEKKPKGETKTSTKDLTYVLFTEGKTITEISKERNLAVSTIEGHMAFFVEKGIIDITKLMSQERLNIIYPQLNSEEENNTLSETKQKVSGDVSFGEIRLVMAYKKFKSSGTV
jgi:hypothetical protein